MGESQETPEAQKRDIHQISPTNSWVSRISILVEQNAWARPHSTFGDRLWALFDKKTNGPRKMWC